MSEHPAIIGGGYLGSAVAEAFEGRCIVTTRSGSWRDGDAPSNVTMATLDITANEIDAAVLRPANAMVIAVAPGRTQDRRAVYVEGPRRLLDAVGEQPWRRVVYISSTSAYPDLDGWVDEDTAAVPSSERGLVQREAEDVVGRWATARGIPWLCLRLGGLYGPGRDLGRVYRRRNDGPLPGDGHAPTNLIHRDDAIAATLAALRAPAELVGVIGVVDDDHSTRRAMYAAVADATGQPLLTWESDPVAGEPPRGKRVSNLRMKLQLGLRLRHPAHVVPGA